MSKIANEIKQTKPFSSLEEETLLNVLRTADYLSYQVDLIMKEANLTGNQYNVLRILRGAPPEGLLCHEVGERMISRVPDVTRMVDRLEARQLVTRTRESSDRRAVRVQITPDGLKALKGLDEIVAVRNKSLLEHLGQAKLQKLCELLEEARP